MKELFEQSLPEFPYCCDDFRKGPRITPLPGILPRLAAIRRRHIQPQPPWERRWLLQVARHCQSREDRSRFPS